MDTYTSEYAALYDRAGLASHAVQVASTLLASSGCSRHSAQALPRMLDLGCGTGAAARVFAAAGYAVVGVDSASEMLRQARYQAEHRQQPATFLQGDMRALPLGTPPLLPGSFDLITCLGRSLNELTNEGDLARVCHAAAVLLRSGGSFVFDVAPAAAYRAGEEQNRVLYQDRDYLLYQGMQYKPRQQRATRRVTWFVREIDLWWRSTVEHHERIWHEHDIAAALNNDTRQHRLLVLARQAIDRKGMQVVLYSTYKEP